MPLVLYMGIVRSITFVLVKYKVVSITQCTIFVVGEQLKSDQAVELRTDTVYENVSPGMPIPQNLPNASGDRELDISHRPSDTVTNREQPPVPEYVNISRPNRALDEPDVSPGQQYEELGLRPSVTPSEYYRMQ